MERFLKDPDAILDYTVDWSGWLAVGETISDSEWVVPDDLDIDSSTAGSGSNTIWLSGGEIRRDYQITNRITTSAGRVDDRSFIIRCTVR